MPTEAPVRERLAAWRLRHHLRREEADRVYLGSRHPERGWPVAGDRAVLDFFVELIRERRGIFVAPRRAQRARRRRRRSSCRRCSATSSTAPSTRTAPASTRSRWLVVGVVVTQAVLTFFAQRTSTLFGQDLLASAREYVVRVILRLPLGQVESASTGDLVTRVTRDVGTMSRSVQYGVPMAIISLLTVSLSVVAMLLNSVLLAVPSLLVIGTSYFAVRSYLRRAPRGYITEGATYSRINTTLTETVEGARTVEALGLSGRRVGQGDDDIAVSAQAERYTMSLRNLLFAVIDIAFNTPRVVTLVVGAWGYAQGWLSLGQITTAVLYVEALSGPLDRLVGELDRLQVGRDVDRPAARHRRGPARPRARATRGPTARSWSAATCGSPTATTTTSCTASTSSCAPASGWRSSARRARASRPSAGCCPASTGRAPARPPSAASTLVDLPLEVLRTEVALVTQEHHVFIGSVRDNIVLAREDSPDEAVWAALSAVGSRDWVERLPHGLDTRIGSGQHALTPAQAQQVALARLIIADPHTLVLDEATSLIDPRTARSLEGSMNALLGGRTVVAIAHRLHTAHDADRIAVVIDGRIAELGSHRELVDLEDGEYAALWRAWTS